MITLDKRYRMAWKGETPRGLLEGSNTDDGSLVKVN